MNSITEKCCTKCGKTKTLDSFYGTQNRCKSCTLEYMKKEYWKNPEKYKALSLKHATNNREKELARAKKWYQEFPEKVKARVAKWRKDHPEKKKIHNQNYSKKHPDKILAKVHRRRAKKLGATGGHFTQEEWQGLLIKYGNKCLCCGRKDIALERDHVIPLGPEHSDEITNIQPLCRSCNARKGNKEIDYR